MRKIIMTLIASVLLALAVTPVANAATPSASTVNRGGTHRVVFKSWGYIPRAMVDISGHNDIEMLRRLPFSQTQYLSGWDYSFADISVEDPREDGYATVGCAIYVDGRLVSRDVSDYGFAWCTI